MMRLLMNMSHCLSEISTLSYILRLELLHAVVLKLWYANKYYNYSFLKYTSYTKSYTLSNDI